MLNRRFVTVHRYIVFNIRNGYQGIGNETAVGYRFHLLLPEGMFPGGFNCQQYLVRYFISCKRDG